MTSADIQRVVATYLVPANRTVIDRKPAAKPAGIPDYAKDKPLPVPQIAKKKLASGLEVWVLPRTGVPRVDMVLAVRDAGLGADDPSYPGSPTCWPDC